MRVIITGALSRLLVFMLVLISSASSFLVFASSKPLGLHETVALAITQDLWLRKSQHEQQALLAMSDSAASLPDPKVSLGLGNLPIDSFSLKQEPMTQVQLGISQMLPRGDSLAIKQKQLQTLANVHPYAREDRRAKVSVQVAHLWLSAFLAEQSIDLINQNRALFEQLADLVKVSYASALGKTRQQDLVRAQLELTRLDDRLTQLALQADVARQKLGEWLTPVNWQAPTAAITSLPWATSADLVGAVRLSGPLPDIPVNFPALFNIAKPSQSGEVIQRLMRHPAVMVLEQQISGSQFEVELAKQSFKPEFGFSAGYAFRQDDLMGRDRADFISLGFSFDLPIFTENKQDKNLTAAIAKSESVKTDKWLLLQNFLALVEAGKVQIERLVQRQNLYHGQLLPQMHEQAEASLTAYTHDDGDFAEVVRARIAELNAQIDALVIDVEKQKAVISLNYYFSEQAEQILVSEKAKGGSE